MKTFLSVVFVSFTTVIYSQTAHWKITEQSGFPVFTSSSPIASEKVNALLQWKCLHKLIGPAGTDVFAKVDEWHTFSGYDVLRNDDRALSVRITWEGCGAYCENYDEYYSFSSSGNLIEGNDLFLASGLGKLRSGVSETRNTLLKDQIGTIKKEIAESSSGGDEDRAMQLEMYEWCLQSRDASYVNENRFYLKGASLWLVEDRCSNHAMQALDDLDQFHLEVTADEFGDVLSAFGKYILGVSAKPAVETSRLKVYSGTIGGKYPIQFLSFSEQGVESYVYCYKKYGIMIELARKETNDPAALVLLESDPNGNPNGTFKLARSAKGMTGKYITAAGKELNVELGFRK